MVIPLLANQDLTPMLVVAMSFKVHFFACTQIFLQKPWVISVKSMVSAFNRTWKLWKNFKGEGM